MNESKEDIIIGLQNTIEDLEYKIETLKLEIEHQQKLLKNLTHQK